MERAQVNAVADGVADGIGLAQQAAGSQQQPGAEQPARYGTTITKPIRASPRLRGGVRVSSCIADIIVDATPST